MSRALVSRAFLTSDESYLRILDGYYQDFLHRPPDPAGQQSWLTLLRSGRTSSKQTGAFFLASQEFLALATHLARS